jgi:hypothetical protein
MDCGKALVSRGYSDTFAFLKIQEEMLDVISRYCREIDFARSDVARIVSGMLEWP